MRIAEQLHDLPRVLLLTGYPPEGGGGGGVILRNLLDGFPADRLIWLATQADVSAKWVWRPDIRRRSVTRRIPGRRFGFIQMFWEGGLHAWEGMDALSLAKDINREWWPQALWVVLDYQNLWAAYEIVTALKVPWHVSVHDDPEKREDSWVRACQAAGNGNLIICTRMQSPAIVSPAAWCRCTAIDITWRHFNCAEQPILLNSNRQGDVRSCIAKQ